MTYTPQRRDDVISRGCYATELQQLPA